MKQVDRPFLNDWMVCWSTFWAPIAVFAGIGSFWFKEICANTGEPFLGSMDDGWLSHFLLRQYVKSYMLETGVTRRTKAMVTGHLTSQSAIVLLVIFPWHGWLSSMFEVPCFGGAMLCGSSFLATAPLAVWDVTYDEIIRARFTLFSDVFTTITKTVLFIIVYSCLCTHEIKKQKLYQRTTNWRSMLVVYCSRHPWERDYNQVTIGWYFNC